MNEEQRKVYLEYLEEHGFEFADQYKNQLIPTKLYKFFPLTEENESAKNTRVFKSLLNEMLWLSSHKKFNDFREFSSFHICAETMKRKGYNSEYIDSIKMVFDEAKKTVLVSCFSTIFDNMPMWAHYANDHRGFCVEYDILRKRNFYPVSYVFEKHDVHDMVVQLNNNYFISDELERANSNEAYKEALFEEQMKMISLMYLNYSTKESSWEYEQEVRLIFSEKEPFHEDGRLIDYHDVMINPRKIIFGNRCTNEHEKILKAIGQRIGVARFERYGD